MAALIVLGLLLALAVIAYFDFRRDLEPDRRHRRTPLDDIDVHTTQSEAREVVLTRQLMAGTISPSIYRRLISELAHGAEPHARR